MESFYSSASSSKTKGDIVMGQGNKRLLDEKWLQALFDRVLPARSWEMPVERKLPAKIGRCSKKPQGCNIDFRKNPRERIFSIYISNILSGGFGSKVKIVTAQLFATPPKLFFSLGSQTQRFSKFECLQQLFGMKSHCIP